MNLWGGSGHLLGKCSSALLLLCLIHESILQKDYPEVKGRKKPKQHKTMVILCVSFFPQYQEYFTNVPSFNKKLMLVFRKLNLWGFKIFFFTIPDVLVLLFMTSFSFHIAAVTYLSCVFYNRWSRDIGSVHLHIFAPFQSLTSFKCLMADVWWLCVGLHS